GGFHDLLGGDGPASPAQGERCGTGHGRGRGAGGRGRWVFGHAAEPTTALRWGVKNLYSMDVKFDTVRKFSLCQRKRRLIWGSPAACVGHSVATWRPGSLIWLRSCRRRGRPGRPSA